MLGLPKLEIMHVDDYSFAYVRSTCFQGKYYDKTLTWGIPEIIGFTSQLVETLNYYKSGMWYDCYSNVDDSDELKAKPLDEE